MQSLNHKDLLGIAQLSPADITLILDTAAAFREIAERPIKTVPTLRGRTVVNLFFESSTRTRSSFEIAEKRLSADVLNFPVSTGAGKGETLYDIARHLEAMAPHMIVVRHSASGTAQVLSRACRASVINAGDGTHEHPTQALLDALTVRSVKGRLDRLKIAIIGDIAHSRVARSETLLFRRMGAEVWVCGPPTLLPWEFGRLGAKVTEKVDEALEGADVVTMLRVQHERQQEGYFPSVREFFMQYGLTRDRLKLAAPDAVVMHPGPINRGVEIESQVADGPSSVILDQVANGIATRMAVLYLFSGNAALSAREQSRL
jgi:aspartate carbamoyltransferase catalytic subunit